MKEETRGGWSDTHMLRRQWPEKRVRFIVRFIFIVSATSDNFVCFPCDDKTVISGRIWLDLKNLVEFPAVSLFGGVSCGCLDNFWAGKWAGNLAGNLAEPELPHLALSFPRLSASQNSWLPFFPCFFLYTPFLFIWSAHQSMPIGQFICTAFNAIYSPILADSEIGMSVCFSATRTASSLPTVHFISLWFFHFMRGYNFLFEQEIVSLTLVISLPSARTVIFSSARLFATMPALGSRCIPYHGAYHLSADITDTRTLSNAFSCIIT